VSTSFSKSFSLYGERVGALSVVCADAEKAKRVLSQLKIVIRTNYSNPPTHGAASWRRCSAIRAARPVGGGAGRDARPDQGRCAPRWSRAGGRGRRGRREYITDQVGMFSFSGLTKDQMVRLRNEFGVYGTDTGRICVAALNDDNIAYVSESIAAVLQD
jgi:aromatic-amino-acid transaminase